MQRVAPVRQRQLILVTHYSLSVCDRQTDGIAIYRFACVVDSKENKWLGSQQSWSKEGTVRHCILWSYHEETRELPGEGNNARNNARCTQAMKTTHGLDRQHRDVGQDSLWKSQSEWQKIEINWESTSIVWTTLGLRTAIYKEQNSSALQSSATLARDNTKQMPSNCASYSCVLFFTANQTKETQLVPCFSCRFRILQITDRVLEAMSDICAAQYNTPIVYAISLYQKIIAHWKR